MKKSVLLVALSSVVNQIYKSKGHHPYLSAFGIFIILIFLIHIFFPAIPLGVLDQLAFAGLFTGCFLGFGVEFKVFLKSLLMVVVLVSLFGILWFFAFRYYEDPNEHLFKIRDLILEFKWFSIVIGSLFLPPVLGYWIGFFIKSGFNSMSQKLKK